MIMLYGSLIQRQSFVKTKHRTRERGDSQNNDHRFYIQKLCLWIAFDTQSTSKLNEVAYTLSKIQNMLRFGEVQK